MTQNGEVNQKWAERSGNQVNGCYTSYSCCSYHNKWRFRFLPPGGAITGPPELSKERFKSSYTGITQLMNESHWKQYTAANAGCDLRHPPFTASTTTLTPVESMKPL
jgi:hypothetical protein